MSGHELPPGVSDVEQRLTEQLRETTGRDDLTVEYDRTPIRSGTLYCAACPTCSAEGENIGEPPSMAAPFSDRPTRDLWASGHAASRGHRVALVEQHPDTGSTITGYVEAPEPDPEPEQADGRLVGALVAFVARSDGPPDLLCRIPPRAGAAWLLTAAHACLLGQGGSLGITQPHRVLLIGRVTRVEDVSYQPPFWHVRVDGLIGATGPTFGDAIGRAYAAAGSMTVPEAEDSIEALIAADLGVERNLFSLLLMADAPVSAPPDPHAEATLREERLAARHAYRTDGAIPDLGTDEPR